MILHILPILALLFVGAMFWNSKTKKSRFYGPRKYLLDDDEPVLVVYEGRRLPVMAKPWT